MKKELLKLTLIGTAALLLGACGGGGETPSEGGSEESAAPETAEVDPMQDKGIGPVKEVKLDAEVNQDWAAEGEKIYNEKCTACHKPHERYVGPAQAGVLDRRTPEWVMNMILNPDEMLQKDPVAKDLLKKFMSPMANQNLTEDEARKVLEYFRTL